MRWGGAFLLILPFAWPHLQARVAGDPRATCGCRSCSPVTGHRRLTDAIAYVGLQYTPGAEQRLLIQSAGPAVRGGFWSLVLFRTRLTMGAGGSASSISLLGGALTVVARGDLEALSSVASNFNKGDLIFGGALMIFLHLLRR